MFVVDVDRSVGDGMIQDTSGDVIFRVTFRAISCKPEDQEVLDGKVMEVTSTGINVQSGPIKTFISLKNTKSKNEYVYDQGLNKWDPVDHDNIDGVIRKDVFVRYKLTTSQFSNNDFVSKHAQLTFYRRRLEHWTKTILVSSTLETCEITRH